ncbi:MAG: hypothetical protein JXA78_11820 [Anaerolineales bacterium]|nr:hypothetical protein [Anaerolineales bacterium]
MTKLQSMAQAKQNQKGQRDAARAAPEKAGEISSLTITANDRLAQAARLGDSRLQSAQRQTLAAQIGQTQGNQHLQTVINSFGKYPLSHSEGKGHLRKMLINPNQSTIQRTPPDPGPAMVTTAGPDVVMKIFIYNVPDTGYISQMRSYIGTTLGAPDSNIISIDTYQQIFEYLDGLRESGTRVHRVIIVSHGSSGESTVAGGSIRQASGWVSTSDIQTYASSSEVAQRVRRDVMAPDALVEFWGCNLGAFGASLIAMSSAFGTDFRAQAGTMQTGTLNYYRPVPRDTPGARQMAGRRGWWIRVINTSQVPAGLQDHFRTWLLTTYASLVASNEITETAPPRTEDESVAYISDLFNRSRGNIRHMQITTDEGEVVTPGQGEDWLRLWSTWDFRPPVQLD